MLGRHGEGKLLREIHGASKRSEAKLLTPEQCPQILSALREPCRTMVLVVICTGLRASELLALKGRTST